MPSSARDALHRARVIASESRELNALVPYEIDPSFSHLPLRALADSGVTDTEQDRASEGTRISTTERWMGLSGVTGRWSADIDYTSASPPARPPDGDQMLSERSFTRPPQTTVHMPTSLPP